MTAMSQRPLPDEAEGLLRFGFIAIRELLMTGLSTLHQIVSEVLRIPPEKIAAKTRIHEVDTWNSLTHIEFVMTIEERFHVQLTEDEIASMTSIEQVQKVLSERGVLA